MTASHDSSPSAKSRRLSAPLRLWLVHSGVPAGHGTHDSLRIDADVGAPQADIFYYYKNALRRSYASDRATRDEERMAARQRRPIDPDQIDALTERHLSKLPYKQSGCRFHSFIIYFSNLQRLRWVEFTWSWRTSRLFQDHYGAGQPRNTFASLRWVAKPATRRGPIHFPLSTAVIRTADRHQLVRRAASLYGRWQILRHAANLVAKDCYVSHRPR